VGGGYEFVWYLADLEAFLVAAEGGLVVSDQIVARPRWYQTLKWRLLTGWLRSFGFRLARSRRRYPR